MEDFYVDGNAQRYHNGEPTIEEILNQLKKEMKMSTYRKLTADELTLYGISAKSDKINSLKNLYFKYFDKTIEPAKALIIINSEYNDGDYDNRVTRVVFYDANDNELVPLKSKSHEYHGITSFDYQIDIKDSTREALEDELVFLVIPTLYVLEE